MAAREYDIHVEQGTTFLFDLIYKDEGKAIDLTEDGWKVRMQVRERFDSEDTLHSFESPDSITLTEDGEITVEASAEETKDWDTDGVYDLEIEDPSGDTVRLVKGRWKVDREVTR